MLDGCAVYTDHINTPRLVTLVNNPLNPVPLTDTSNDLAQTSGDAIHGISPLAMPVWQMAYSPFGVDLANGYEARPTTINNNFKTDLWEWLGLPTIGGAGDWSWYAGGGNGLANGSVLTAPMLNIRYLGQYYDAESGLSQNWWRSYDARMGRYTQNDPIGLEGGMNRFNYVDGDGVNNTDPFGLKKVILLKPDDPNYPAAVNEPDDSNTCLVISHGSNQSVNRMNASQLNRELSKRGCTPKQPVKLDACRAGQGDNSIAEQLARLRKSTVVAPDDRTWTTPWGTSISTPYPPVSDDPRSVWNGVPNWSQPGNWRTFGGPK